MDAAYLQRFLSDAARQATRNEIRELLKLIARPQIISLAGGLPSPESFPLADLAELLPAALEREGVRALQYGPTEGDLGLRRELIRMLRGLEGGVYDRLEPEGVLITSASQQGLDLCGRAFVSPGDVVLCELPSYLGALGAFAACGARLVGVPLDEAGLRTDLLERRLLELRREGARCKLLYTVPDFQNPSGVTLGRARRDELLALAREFDLLVVEDSPYRQLRYVGQALPALGALDRDGRVISLFTFSKMLFPGLRLGWLVADPEIVSRLVVAKQPVDLCTSGLAQLVARELLTAGRLPLQLERVRRIYAGKRLAILEALERLMRPEWGVRWSRPEGGMFVWLTLPDGLDAALLLERAIAENVAFVAGRAFHCDGSGRNTLRLNFSYPALPEIDVAIERLARCIGALLREGAPATPPAAASAAPSGGDHALEQLAWNLVLSEIVE